MFGRGDFLLRAKVLCVDKSGVSVNKIRLMIVRLCGGICVCVARRDYCVNIISVRGLETS